MGLNKNLIKYLSGLSISLLINNLSLASEEDLLRRINDLENKVLILEQQQTANNNLWKDVIIWQRLKKEMTTSDVEKLFGKPSRIEKAIFTTWYYHSTSKTHSFVWFDEGKVLGWETPE